MKLPIFVAHAKNVLSVTLKDYKKMRQEVKCHECEKEPALPEATLCSFCMPMEILAMYYAEKVEKIKRENET